MAEFFIAVGCSRLQADPYYVEMQLGSHTQRWNMLPETARCTARKLYWAARMVDRLNSEKEKETAK